MEQIEELTEKVHLSVSIKEKKIGFEAAQNCVAACS